MIIEGFGDYYKKEKGVFYEGKCYLKTKTDHFKSHWAVLDGNEILFYRKQGEDDSRVMHILACAFIQEISTEKDPDTNVNYYPIKIFLPPVKSRIIYFETIEQQQDWTKKLK